MLRAALAVALVLAVGGQLDGLLPASDRPRAFPAPVQELPDEAGPAQDLAWPSAGVVDCGGHCAMQVPKDTKGELWVVWDGRATMGFVAALADKDAGDAKAGVPGFDSVRVGRVRGGESLLLWGSGRADVVVQSAVGGAPNLVAIAPAHLGWPLGGDRGHGAPAAGARNCLAEEVRALAVRDCLRFTTGVANTGDTPLSLSSRERGSGVAMVQALPGDDHAGGTASYHAAHGHFHYARFIAFDLHRIDPGTGLRGEAVLSLSKTGFCVVDWGPLADAHRLPVKTFWRDDCEPHSRRLEMGVNPGWYDIYRWFLPEQVLDVAGLPAGTYELVATVDPDATLSEAHRLDNRASTVFSWDGGVAIPLEERGLYRL